MTFAHALTRRIAREHLNIDAAPPQVIESPAGSVPMQEAAATALE